MDREWPARRRPRRESDFYAGELYASFLFITKSLETRARPRAANFPMTGASNPELIARTVQNSRIDTLAGVPTTILSFAQHAMAHGLKLPSVRRRALWRREHVPRPAGDACARVPGCSSGIDRLRERGRRAAGLCRRSRAERRSIEVFERETIIELVDEDTGELIREPGRPGKVILTNLTRLLMPVIRYPAGDRAMWVEPEASPCRKFALLGRSEEAARVGPVSLYYEGCPA